MNKIIINTRLMACVSRNRRTFTKLTGVTILAMGLNGCSGMGSLGTAVNMYQMLGGADAVSSLSGGLLTSAMKDPRLSGLLGSVDPATASPKVADQMCAELGGGCKAPFSSQQVAAGADRLTPEQQTAVSDNLSKSLNSVTSNPMVRDTVTKTLGSKMGGILGALN